MRSKLDVTRSAEQVLSQQDRKQVVGNTGKVETHRSQTKKKVGYAVFS